MNLRTVGHLLSERRRARGLTLQELADKAAVGRSTLAALEAGKLRELGFERVARLCAAVGLLIEVRPRTLEMPLMRHRHLTEHAGLELTKAAIEDVIVRGDFAAWRGLINAMAADETGGIESRVRQVTAALDRADPKVHAFATLLPQLVHRADAVRAARGQEVGKS